MNLIYHIYSRGKYVVFPEEQDYLMFVNKLAINSFVRPTKIWAYSIMSTHFHLVVETQSEQMLQKFIRRLRLSYSRYYLDRYGWSPFSNMKTSYRRLKDYNSIKTALNYVMRNPYHHYITSNVFNYPYTSLQYVFASRRNPERAALTSETQLVRVSNLTKRAQKVLLNKELIPESYMVNKETMTIYPPSFLQLEKVEHFYKDDRDFMYTMLDAKTLDANHEAVGEEKSEIYAGTKLTDLAVCGMINRNVHRLGVKSFHFLTIDAMNDLILSLHSEGVADDQITRCLWLKRPIKSNRFSI